MSTRVQKQPNYVDQWAVTNLNWKRYAIDKDHMVEHDAWKRAVFALQDKQATCPLSCFIVFVSQLWNIVHNTNPQNV